jgi:hypothetical protein
MKKLLSPATAGRQSPMARVRHPQRQAKALATTRAPRKTPRKLTHQTSSRCTLLELHMWCPLNIALLGSFKL